MFKRDILNKSLKSRSLGRGGPMDMNTFNQGLNQARNRILGFSNLANNVNSATTPTTAPIKSGGHGFRTDRNNNPTAMTTDVAKYMGLRQGVDYTTGDPFTGSDGRTYYTAKLLGNPIDTTIKALNNGGFYTAAGHPRWTYLAAIPGVQNWQNLNYNQKVALIGQMYHHEGGSGSLIQNNNGQVAPQSGLAALQNLGNLTSTFGEKTPDTSFHRGLDIANAKGTPIPKIAPVPGQVSYVGQNGDYGNELKVQNVDGTNETYGHLSSTNVQAGQIVQPGQQLGLMGASGNAWSPTGSDPSHLHLEITDVYNRLVDPLAYLNQNPYG